MVSVTPNINTINYTLSSCEKFITDVGDNISKIIADNEVIKTYDELKKGNYPEIYGGVIDSYNYIGSSLSKTSLSLIDIRTLKKQIISNSISLVPSVERVIRARLENIIKDFEDLRSSLVSLKDVYEAKLRFYNTCQYLMTNGGFIDRS